jgi:hypothetical protein
VKIVTKSNQKNSSNTDMEKMSKEELIQALNDSQDLNKKLLELMEMHNNKVTQISIESLETQLKSSHRFLAELEDSEPPKIFKSIHNEWQESVDKVKKDIEELDKKLFEEYTEFGKYIEKKAKKNKDND